MVKAIRALSSTAEFWVSREHIMRDKKGQGLEADRLSWWQRRERHYTRFVYLQYVIDHHAHGLAAFPDKCKRAMEELPSSFPVYRRKND